MKKTIVGLTLAAAILGSSVMANADALKNSALPVDVERLNNQESFEHDTVSGEWSLTPNRAAAALDALCRGYGVASSGSTLFMYVSFEGNTLDNTVEPMLNIYCIGSASVNANAVSLLIDGVRCDFETTCEESTIGKYRAEIMRAPLNADGIAMLRVMAESDEFAVMLHGSERVNEYTVKTSSTSNERNEMQAASAVCVREALAIYDALGAGAGNARAISDWEEANDLTCAYVEVKISEQPRVSLDLDEDFDVLKFGDSSSSVKKLQELLCDAGYMYVDPVTRFSAQTRAAVIRAQKALGFVPTGSADAALINALDTKADTAAASADQPVKVYAAVESDTDAQPGEMYEVADEAAVSIDSYRIVSRTIPSDGDETAAVSASDSDNVLVIFDGSIENVSSEEKDVTWDYTATLTLNGKYEYECTLAVEQEDGTSYGSTLLPLGGGNLIVYAEVPKNAVEKAVEWKLAIKLGNVTLTYTAE